MKDGKRAPVVYSQLMSDMRGNIQVSPWPERYIKDDIRRMMECGVNVCATTAMPWLYDDFRNPTFNYNGDAMKYSLDVARKMGMKFEAWGSYPFDRSSVADIYHELTGDTGRRGRCHQRREAVGPLLASENQSQTMLHEYPRV